MPLIRLIVLFLLMLPSVALAGAVTLLPGPPVVSDGKSSATVRIWVPGIQGTDKVRVTASEGRVSEAEIGADGVITVTLIGPSIKAAKDLSLGVKIQGVSLKVDEAVTVPLVPPYAGNLKVSFEPPEFVGGNSGVLVRVTPDASTPQSAEARRMLGAASAGTLDSFVAAGDGTFVARWSPPAGLAKSRTAIITVVDAAAPDKVQGWAALPVMVKQSVTLNAAPGSNNILLAGDRQWGPLQASPAGTVAFDVEVNPAKTSARLQTVIPGGAKTETAVELPVDEYDRVSFFPLPSAIPASPEAKLTVRFAVTKRSGEPLSNAPISVRATAGLLGTPVATSKAGVYEAVFTPPEQPSDVIFTAEVEGSKAEARTRVVPALPSVSISSEPEELPKGVNAVTLTARVKDARGAGVVGRTPEILVQGGSRGGAFQDKKDGTYTGKLTLTSKEGYMLVTADPPVEASALAPAQLLIWTARSVLPANGAEAVAVTVAAVDAFGMPVADVKLKMSVPVGDGTMAPDAVTNKKGLARVTFKSGVVPGPATLRVDGAGLWTSTLIFQQGPGVVAPTNVPTGAPDAVAALVAWQSAAPAIIVSREGSAPVAKAGPPAVVTLSTVPPYTTPGAAILVVARVSDQAGIPVTKQKLNITASVGTVGAITDNGDGSYTFPLQLAAGQDGPVTISLGVGSAVGSVVLPTLATLNAMPAATQGGGGGGNSLSSNNGGGGGGREPRPGRQPRQGGGFGGDDGLPWGQASIALATVARSYHLESSGDADVPSTANFGTGALFGAFGLDARVVAFPRGGNIGGVIGGRGYFDRVEIGDENYSQFGWSARAGVRYRGEMAEGLYWYGSGELARFNGLVFRYADDAKTEAALLSKGLFGARLGGGVTFNKGPLGLDIGVAETFSPWPVDTWLGVDVNYEIKPNLAVRAGYELDLRSMKFAVGEEEVKVKDQERPLFVGVSYLFK